MALINQSGQQVAQGNDAPKIEFPCENYVVKVVALDKDESHGQVMACVLQHAPEVQEHHVTSNRSSKGTFISYTYRIIAQSENQLASLHKDLMALSIVKMVM